VLEATVLGIQRVTKPFNDDKGKPVEKMQFEFEISEDSEFKGRKIKGETSTNFTNHPNCRMRNWVQEILATELPAGFRFNPEAVRGSSVRIVVGKKVKPRRDGGGDWIDNSVKDVWRQKAAAAKSDDSLVHQSWRDRDR
jgi:hypothetical protein